jgi:ubiquinone/menaquinone biosynthesis C-methylase UbiE/ribosomal protein S27AE
MSAESIKRSSISERLDIAGKKHNETRKYYDQYHFIEGGMHRVRWWQDYLREYLPDEKIKGKLIADVGCSVGEITRGLVLRGARMTCLDLSLNSLKRCRQINKEPVLFHGTAIEQPFADETFDHAISIGVLMITPDCRKGFKEVARIVKPGGTIVIFLYSKWNWFNLAYKLFKPIRSVIPLSSVPRFIVRMMQPFVKNHLGQKLDDEQLRRLLGDKLWTPHATFHSIRQMEQWGEEEGLEVIGWKRFYLGYANTMCYRKKGKSESSAPSQIKLRCLKCKHAPLTEHNGLFACGKCGSTYENENGIMRFQPRD